MTSLIPRHLVFPDLMRMLEGGWPFVAFGDHHPVRIENYRDNGNYVLRAELPGMDPEKDIQITVEGNDLAITAERTVETHDMAHTEFSYGSFTRTVRLPISADTDKVSAKYTAGILEVTVPVKEPVATKKVEIGVTKEGVR